MAAEEEEEGGGEVTIGGVRVHSRAQMKKEKVSDHVWGDCCPACRPFWSYPPSLLTIFPLVSSEAEELGSRELDIGSKKIFIDLRLNDQGKFVRIVEASTCPSPSSSFPFSPPLPASFQHMFQFCDRIASCVMLGC